MKFSVLCVIFPVALCALCPDQETRCDSKKTCCLLQSGGYGCCPLPNAVCCNDKEHCCPSGYTCDVEEGTCNKESETIPWMAKEMGEHVESVICRDKKHYCQDKQTCCQSKNGTYGCCPVENANCCSDMIHCCPNGYTCEGSSGKCYKSTETVSWTENAEANVRSVTCPGGQTQCPDGNTCCLLPSGEYGCCPQPNAVCCSDHLHCCPSGYTCDVSQGTCTRGNEVMTWFEKTEAKSMSVVCPDGQSECPDGNTCCLLSSGQYGCCPIPNAVCCSDHLHCCPSGYTCDVSQGTCTKGNEMMTWFVKTEAKLKSVVCPDGQSECPDGNTCCLLSSGQYGCCPIPNAVCCSDHLHCCPSGYTCDVSQGTCTRGNEVMAWFEKTEAKSKSVVCPDGQSECPDGNTCCLLSSGQYGCCPIPNAVCCSDHLHCCPSGYTCDVSQGTCTRGNEVMTWFEKTEAKSKSVVCPDGQSECPDGNTCCKLSSGQYGCCPIPNAVCCSDHLHCCPSGYTCDVSQGTCSKGNEVMTWFEKTEAKLKSVVCPDGQSECPDGNTCCLLSSGQYGCCPIPKAVCCSDHLHCCPSGYTCDVSQGTCSKGNEVITWFEKTEAKSKSVVCPDGQSECPDGNTCCLLSSGQYGCCPIPNAVCCSDHLHCCPSGYTCDVSQGTCTRGNEVMTWFEKTEAKSKSVVCPDGQSECPDGNTCCLLSSGQYGCCPIPNAVCCSDHLHCCPSGYTCDVSQGTCTRGNEVMAWFEKTEAKSKSVVCPDGQSECPDGNTCCLLSSGQYGCCPIPNAVCCSDHLHCCPSGYTCDVSQGTCSKGNEVMTWFEKTEAKSKSVVCPDGQSECPDGNTCCLLSSGQYGCCPIPNAVCCSDHLHCCPSGYTCDVSQGTCTRGNEVMTWFEKTEAKSMSVVCPDGQSECPDGNTCCLLSSGQYGCCPIPNAVCCSDHLHCCPSGYTCDVSQGTCTRGNEVMTWFEKTEAKSKSVVCPDGQSECPDGNTCCKLSSGQYGCCPIPNAVCCSDHLHCCLSGYTCDVSQGTCSKGNEVMTWFEKTEAKSKSVVCPDGQSECPDGNTCCLLSSGQYGCCPIPNAVCCSDHLHCCPSGYTCDVSQGTCTRGNEVMAWFEKTEAKSMSVVCPDGQSECPDGNTCCKLSSGQYGCCPIPNAVCCSDHLHCCPSGYTCDVSQGTCSKGNEVMTWFEKTEAKSKSVVCPDGQSECPDGNTCCLLSSGQYGCCPIPNAVCCSDHLHCCPSGYTCDVSQGTCTRGNEVMAWFEKTEAKSMSVVCPDGQSECPDGNTCCKLSSGQYGCCPIPNAVCCSDHLHCCPSGYTCDVSQGTCSKGNEVMTWFEKTEAKSKSVVCPDGQSECPDGNTCCLLSSGQYGCCPIPNAVCCSDHLHCCPSGYTCDVSQGTCTRGNEVMTWFEKTEAKSMSVVCPDGQSECPDGNTCCKLSSGQYGCCPIPNAVCCSDHLHCCPSGYTCDVSQGTCSKGNEVMAWFEKTEAKSKSVVCPDGQSECPDGNTCCLLSSGQYGCCPIPNAVCCSDHLHCCPSGYTCDVSQGTCTRGNEVMAWFEKTEAKSKSVVCPDGQSECPDGNTCCLLSSGQYGCCPIPNAVCCSDHLHCCPSGYTCDVSQGTCTRGNEVMAWFEKTEAKSKSVVCPDGQSECPDGNTCCLLSSGQYGCCPIPNAVCCSDHLHCCPSGYTCDVSQGTCSKGNEVMTWFEKTEAKSKSVVCPDGQSECPDGNTCCLLSSGQYGCCPIPNAVCCSDHLHCCPSGYTCDVSQGTCSKGNEVMAWFEKTQAKSKSVVCPDGQSECPDGNTCCLLSSGQYGCCPIPNAVCCSDHLHCCPSGYTCDVSQGTCTRGNEVMTWFEKTEAKSKSVVCPDGQSECPDGNTCCLLSSGQYGCCPIPNAVCCSDHLHCCPSGYTCDVSQGTCTRGNEVMAWFEKTEAKSKSVVCPDGQSECPDGNTCCLLSSGQYGCCPIPNAVCCSDHLHCCPSGYTCDVSQGTCSKGNEVMAWFEKTQAKSKSVVCPDGQSECPDGNTCCLLSSGQYGCCPIPNAVCCSDHLHCCPSGYTCDVSQGTCTRGNEVMTWFEKTQAKSKSVVCPDGQSECPDGNTCCLLSSGQYGCCPIPNAVCCSDHLHCCPSGYTCDVSQGTCTRGNEVMAWFEKTEAKSKSVVCPDGQSECPDGNTCCLLSSGQYGCCPIPNAVCCSDHLHCCPSGYTCDVSQGTCTRGNEVMAWFEKTEAKSKSVVCPDGQSECPDGNTCCLLSSGQYGCCPIPNAVCCSDHLHCCPSGYTCDVSQGTCSKGNEVMTWFEKTEAKSKSVVCPDGQSECPDGNTCCLLSSGQYGCCPIPNAVCCSDHLHCCPSGYTCDVSQGTCSKGNEVMAWFEKTQAKSKSVVCPDGQSECPDGNTCCLLSSGQYGCCPIPNAVCCSDHLHCCPSGYTCDVSQGTCSKGNEVMAWFEKTQAKSKSVVCPDGQSECPDGNTCCLLSSGQYGCCPIPNAVCCSDHLHCCPSGYTCDVSQGTCTRGNEVMTWFEKTEAKSKSVVCPDGQSECPDGNTCCLLSSGQYGCCPIPNAVCCSDHLHCCPSGYTCDVSQGTCTRGNEVMAWFEKTEAKSKSVVCPDGQSECPDGNTCCLLSSGQYGCCPIPNAVCCSDHLHCCPSGYTCDVSQGTCTRGNEVMAWFEKTEAKSKSVVCPDGQSECPDGNTCCLLSSGQYGCCPIPNAVCCSDHLHCCPSGYTCDVSEGTCTRGNEVMAWFEKTEAKSKSVVCPDGQSECPDGNTCCLLSSGQYGCCPIPNAVCCSDHLHCCPSGYTCDVSQGTCTRGNEVMAWFEKTQAKSKSVVCPDGQSECPDGNTCCKLSSGQYGCCPIPNAVCCSDHLHCCPSGYTCDVSQGTCSKGDEVITWFEKTEAITSPSNLLCPDGSECLPDNTCCVMSNGQYGCCPMPNAVCCDDHRHCCPSGYSCNTEAGACTRGKHFMQWFEKTPSRPGRGAKLPLQMFTCPDNKTICPEGSTCCPGDSEYSCCPAPHATCCADQVHCCPEDFKCINNSTTCQAKSGKSVVAALKKIVGKKLPLINGLQACGDGTACPSNSTCCIQSDGSYGCCPLVNATCCPDKIHCCPHGFKCYDESSTCLQGNVRLPSVEKLPSIPHQREHMGFNQICKDGKSRCPDNFTCCEEKPGTFACCPLKHAVCCEDKQHCCPSGYTCDLVRASCSKGTKSITWLKKVPSLSLPQRSKEITCPDNYQTCPVNTTCCRINDDLYGCCPHSNAVCCDDGRHCCPAGFSCDAATGTCSDGSRNIPVSKKFPSKK